ncbi:MAG TPA: cell wall hydrolase [Gammaproteobacteria bacterium]|nr:cell wall hydrolase [Gammaproteobacteria bacterium]
MSSILRIRDRLTLATWRFRAWRDGVRYSWQARDKGALIFFALLSLPFAAFGGFARVAYLDHAERRAASLRTADLTCLAENVYHEARGEPLAGQYAVAEVTLNRVASPFHPSSICEVVHQQAWDARRRRYVGAFSWTEIKETLRRPRGGAWRRAVEVATAAYERRAEPQLDGALFYHTTDVEPAWARDKTTIATIGNHVFYR